MKKDSESCGSASTSNSSRRRARRVFGRDVSSVQGEAGAWEGSKPPVNASRPVRICHRISLLSFMEVIHRFLRPLRHAALMVLLLVLPVCSASAQNFRKANSETRVSKVSFKFVDRRTFDESRLREQIATTAPGFWALVQKILPFTSPKPHLLDPVELQKDVKRLELFYNKNGFLHPEIDYAASQLDTARNAIHVIFTIEEGPPVIIQDVGFYGADREYAVYQFPEELRPAWTDFRERTTV